MSSHSIHATRRPDAFITYPVVVNVEIRLLIVVAGGALVGDVAGEDSGCSPIVASKSFTFGRITGTVALVGANVFAAAL